MSEELESMRALAKALRATGDDDPNLAEMCWPIPGSEEYGEIVWRLAYGTPTRHDLIAARDVMMAYYDLIKATGGRRARIGAALKRVMKKRAKVSDTPHPAAPER